MEFVDYINFETALQYLKCFSYFFLVFEHFSLASITGFVNSWFKKLSVFLSSQHCVKFLQASLLGIKYQTCELLRDNNKVRTCNFMV